MPDLIRHPAPFWIPAFAGITTVGYLAAEVIIFTGSVDLSRFSTRGGGFRSGLKKRKNSQ